MFVVLVIQMVVGDDLLLLWGLIYGAIVANIWQWIISSLASCMPSSSAWSMSDPKKAVNNNNEGVLDRNIGTLGDGCGCHLLVGREIRTLPSRVCGSVVLQNSWLQIFIQRDSN